MVAFFENIPAVSPKRILESFKSIGKPAFVSVFTSRGFQFSGRVLAISEERSQSWLSMQEFDASWKETDNIIYLALDDVTCVKVHRADQLLKELSFGSVAHAHVDPAPTPLELNRKIEEMNGQLKHLGLGFKIEAPVDAHKDSKDVLLNLSDLVVTLPTVLGKIAADKVGRDALTAIDKVLIQHEAGKILTASRDANALTVTLDLTRALPLGLGTKLETALKASL